MDKRDLQLYVGSNKSYLIDKIGNTFDLMWKQINPPRIGVNIVTMIQNMFYLYVEGDSLVVRDVGIKWYTWIRKESIYPR